MTRPNWTLVKTNRSTSWRNDVFFLLECSNTLRVVVGPCRMDLKSIAFLVYSLVLEPCFARLESCCIIRRASLWTRRLPHEGKYQSEWPKTGVGCERTCVVTIVHWWLSNEQYRTEPRTVRFIVMLFTISYCMLLFASFRLLRTWIVDVPVSDRAVALLAATLGADAWTKGLVPDMSNLYLKRDT
jgi:hypothetical protein